MHKYFARAFALMSLIVSMPAWALEEHMAKPWQLGFQPAASPVMEKLVGLNDFLTWIIAIITIVVLVLMVYICVKFRRAANPVPSKTTHNTRLEVIWTTIPILVLIAIAIPSLRLHYYMEKDVDPEMTLKVVGHQWYWEYQYPDQGNFSYDSNMLKDNELKEGDHRLLSVDNQVVLPVDTKIRVQMTGADVIHSWALPAFGVKRDAVPGRLNETWFEANKIGRYYGQCSELCGVGHGFMPIVVDIVSKEEFASWVATKGGKMGASEVKEGNTPEENAKPSTSPVAKAVSPDVKAKPSVVDHREELKKQ